MTEAKKTVKKVSSVKKAAAPKVEKKVVAKISSKGTSYKVVATTPKTEKVEGTLKVTVYDATGKEAGTVTLPESVFGVKINTALMSQAVRVYLTNQRMGSANTQTRGEVDGSTRKIYRQKGTGRARHGGVRAPIFVGGGVAHGPKVKEYELKLPAKMKRAALLSALSQMAKDGNIKVVTGFESIEPKTKVVAQAFSGMGLKAKKAMLVMPKQMDNVVKAARNVDKLAVAPANMLSTYAVLNAGVLVLMKEAVEVLSE